MTKPTSRNSWRPRDEEGALICGEIGAPFGFHQDNDPTDGGSFLSLSGVFEPTGKGGQIPECDFGDLLPVGLFVGGVGH